MSMASSFGTRPRQAPESAVLRKISSRVSTKNTPTAAMATHAGELNNAASPHPSKGYRDPALKRSTDTMDPPGCAEVHAATTVWPATAIDGYTADADPLNTARFSAGT